MGCVAGICLAHIADKLHIVKQLAMERVSNQQEKTMNRCLLGKLTYCLVRVNSKIKVTHVGLCICC